MELLKKIKALAECGVGGERETAQTILSRLMKQYKITETDLEEEQREISWFTYKEESERKLLNQIIYMVTGSPAFGCVGTYTNRKRKKLGAECTIAERLEIEANYEFFKVAMQKELEIFYEAFANKNNLFPSVDKLNEQEANKPTPEEYERRMKVLTMMDGMEQHTLRKAITAGETLTD